MAFQLLRQATNRWNFRIMSSSFSAQPAAGRSRRVTVSNLNELYRAQTPLVVLTAYDFCMASAMNDCVDIALVGDSAAMVVQGHASTTPMTLAEMIGFSNTVVRGTTRPLVVVDMPFGTYLTIDDTLRNAARLVQEGGASAVKLEGGRSQAAKVAALVREGIPVMGHVGLLPQTCTSKAGYRLAGRTSTEAVAVLEDALAVQDAGAFSVVLEKIPFEVAARITSALSIPTIGIGAGPYCSGQVLVSHDILGLFPNASPPRFVRQYAALGTAMRGAFEQFASDVRGRRFPPQTTEPQAETSTPAHSFSMPSDEQSSWDRLADECIESRQARKCAMPATWPHGRREFHTQCFATKPRL